MTHGQPDERVDSVSDIVTVQLRKVRGEPAHQLVRGDLKQSGRGRQQRQHPCAACGFLADVGRIGCQDRFEQRAGSGLIQRESHRTDDGLCGIAAVFIENSTNPRQEPFSLTHHQGVTQPLLVPELFVQRRPRDPDPRGYLSHAHPIPPLFHGQYVSCREHLLAHVPSERHAHRLARHGDTLNT